MFISKVTSKILRLGLPALCGVLFFGTVPAQAAALRIVGSSTVFPFSSVVAETYGRGWFRDTPVVESTGTGGGMKLFCASNDNTAPDLTNASRRIKSSEYTLCRQNGVELLETKIGYDGIVIANSRRAAKMDLSLKQLYLALAKSVPANGRCDTQNCRMIPNPYRMWSDVDNTLPRTRIEVLGPPPTSGTRDAFLELAMEGGAKSFPGLAALRNADKSAFKQLAHTLREDGAWIDAGENDNLIVQKLNSNSRAFGVFGYSFLEENIDQLQGSSVDGVEPEFALIARGAYPVSRSLYVYMRLGGGQQSARKAFMEEFLSQRAMDSERGYLIDRGLIPLPAGDLDSQRRNLDALRPFDM